MYCPSCNQSIPRNVAECPNCRTPLYGKEWVTVVRVYPPGELVVEGYLNSFGIPVRLVRHDIAQFPMSIGPMAEVEITVPAPLAEEARRLLSEAKYQEDGPD